MAEWPDKVEVSISALKTDLWKMAATTHVSASDQFMPQTRYVARLGLLAFDNRIR